VTNLDPTADLPVGEQSGRLGPALGPQRHAGPLVALDLTRRQVAAGSAVDELTARAQTYARGARAGSTWAAYDRQWRRFETWCVAVGERSLPADPLTVARFLAELAPIWRPGTPADPATDIVEGQVCECPGLRPGSLRGYLAAISVAHATANAVNPTGSEAVRATMAGIARHPGVPPVTRRAAARRDDIAAIIAAMTPEAHLADARDTALILIGWKAALRASDLAGMRLQDQRLTADGLAVHLRRSKTDQTGTGATIGITATTTTADTATYDPLTGHIRDQPRGTPAEPDEDEDNTDADAVRDGEIQDRAALAAVSLDAVAAWRRWKQLLGGHGLIDGPAWRGIDRYGRRPRATGLTRNSIRLIVIRRAEAAGLDPTNWGAHSLRRGFATEAIARRVPERDVQRHGRWKSRASMDPYIEIANTFDMTNPTRWLD
jgi:integrase